MLNIGKMTRRLLYLSPHLSWVVSESCLWFQGVSVGFGKGSWLSAYTHHHHGDKGTLLKRLHLQPNEKPTSLWGRMNRYFWTWTSNSWRQNTKILPYDLHISNTNYLHSTWPPWYRDNKTQLRLSCNTINESKILKYLQSRLNTLEFWSVGQIKINLK